MSIRVGPHVSRDWVSGKRPSIAAHIMAAVKSAADEANFEMRAAAIFVGGPQNRIINLHAEEGRELRSLVESTGLTVIAHSSYTAHPWGGDPDAARYIREEVATCMEAGIAGLVVHLPKLPPASVVKYAARLLVPEAAGRVRIYLETPAVRPTETYYETPEKLAALFAALRAEVDPALDHFGVCIDTAHLWTCGVDLQERAAAAAWLARLERQAAVIPPAATMYHLNDSQRERGIGPDTHEALAQGKIWNGFRGRLPESGLAAFVDHAARYGQVAILERKPNAKLIDDYMLLTELGV